METLPELEQTEHGTNTTVTRERVNEILYALASCLPPEDMVNEPGDVREQRLARRKEIIDSLTDEEFSLFFDMPGEGYIAPRPKSRK